MSEPPAPTQAQIHKHREMLCVTCLVVVLSFLLEVRPDDRVVLHGWTDYPAPPVCMSNAWFGVKCPGCGLTRSFIHLAHGNWEASIRIHRLGWLLAAAVLIQFPYRLASLRSQGHAALGTIVPKLFGYSLIVLLVANWLLDVILTSS